MKKFLIFALIFFALVLVFFHFRKKPAVQVAQPGSKSGQVQNLPAINGLLVNPDLAARRPIAVMVENHPDARPQSGLTDADLVYETLAEGGITRFMAVYQTQKSPNIGPVRSARVYFADFANELGAVYAHVGGNSDALANIRANVYNNISDADQFFNDPYFHRIKSRFAPHNVYTSTDKLKALMAAHKYDDQATFRSWLFKDDAAAATSSASTINIDFSQPSFAVAWHYNRTDNSYKRFLAGKPHKDLDIGKQITAKNIIVQFVNISPSQTDTILSINMDLVAGGKAKIFLDGKETDALWKKQTDDRTRYYTLDGNEISFNRGATWIEIVPVDRPVTWQ